MKLKGIYSGTETYDVGDVVLFENGVYHKQKDGEYGSPKETRCWGQVAEPLATAVKMIMDAVERYFVNDQTLVLATDEGKYAITVDDSGEAPELAVEAIEEGE